MVDHNPSSSTPMKKTSKAKALLIAVAGFMTLTTVATIVLLLFTFRPYYIPAGSMKPNLLVGDYLIVNKLSFGFLKNRLWGTGPERGDVAVFTNPHDGRTFVKRTVGIPGDTIQMKEGVLFVNGVAAHQEAMADYAEPLTDYSHERGCIKTDDTNCYIQQFMETLPNGVSYPIFNLIDEGQLDNTKMWTIPEGQYFVMGDNRDNSNDSRLDVGLVPAENFIGKASLVVFSSSGKSLLDISSWRSDRYFKWVK